MKKNILMALAAVSLMTACDYNEEYFEGFDEIGQENVQKYIVEYTDKTFKATDEPKKTILPWLETKYYTCTEGSFASVSYMQESVNTKKVVSLNEDFDRNVVDKQPTLLAGWLNHATKGEKAWYDKGYKGAIYTECSAYREEGKVVSWMISPNIKVAKGDVLSFDLCVGNYRGDVLKVKISTSFEGNSGSINSKYTKWDDVTKNFTIPQEPVKGYGKMQSAGSLNLDKYAGKEIYVAFVYEGDGKGATTTIQLDNIQIARTESEVVAEKQVDEYDFKEGKWVFKRTVPKDMLFETIEMDKADFQLVVDYVRDNFNKGYLDTQKVGKGEYYYGANSSYANWNAKGSTRKKYYDPEKVMVNMSDDEVNAYAFAQVKKGLVKFVELKHPEPEFVNGQFVNYKVISKIYGVDGTNGTSTYLAKIVWNEEAKKFELESLDVI